MEHRSESRRQSYDLSHQYRANHGRAAWLWPQRIQPQHRGRSRRDEGNRVRRRQAWCVPVLLHEFLLGAASGNAGVFAGEILMPLLALFLILLLAWKNFEKRVRVRVRERVSEKLH